MEIKLPQTFKTRHSDIQKKASLLFTLYEEQDRELREHINSILAKLKLYYIEGEGEEGEGTEPASSIRLVLPFELHQKWSSNTLSRTNRKCGYAWDANKPWPLTKEELQILEWNGVPIAYVEPSTDPSIKYNYGDFLTAEERKSLIEMEDAFTLKKTMSFPVKITKTVQMKFRAE